MGEGVRHAWTSGGGSNGPGTSKVAANNSESMAASKGIITFHRTMEISVKASVLYTLLKGRRICRETTKVITILA